MAQQIEQIDWNHWIIRLIAFVIDGIILAIVTAIITSILGVLLVLSGGIGFFFAGWAFLGFSFIWGVLLLLYFMILDIYWGATIGKRILGLQVQTVSGGKIDFGKSFIRNISKIFWLFLILDWIVGIVTPGDKRQKYMDRIAGAVVVQTKPSISVMPPPPPPPPT